VIFVLSGPGGVGKGTVAEILVSRDPSLWLSRSWTTRARRPGESADAYHFVSRDEFEAAIAADGFLEWVEFQGNLMGTPWPDPDEPRDVLLEIDVQGARAVRHRGADGLLLIFLDAPSREAQAARLRGRGDHEDAVLARLHVAGLKRALAEELGATIVINDEIEPTIARLQELIADARAEASGG
jgi:guanylate kinase